MDPDTFIDTETSRDQGTPVEALALIAVGVALALFGGIQALTGFSDLDGTDRSIAAAPYWQVAALGVIVVALGRILLHLNKR